MGKQKKKKKGKGQKETETEERSMLVCLLSAMHLLARALSLCVQCLSPVILWTIWILMLLQGVDLGCSLIRLAVLAIPFVMSEWFVRGIKLVVKIMWPSWLVRLVEGYWSSTAAVSNSDSLPQPAAVSNAEVHNGHHALDANLTSVGEYLDANPATMSHPTFQFQIPTREGLHLWQGFLDIVLNAYEGNESWAGTFTEEHLRMSGSECKIEMEPSYPATFENLLLDLAQLAALLIAYFETPNQLAPPCIQELYSAMITPLLGPVPVPSAQQLENFLKFMRNQPGLKPPRKSSTFLAKVFQARRGMGPVEKASLDAAIAKVTVLVGWMDDVAPLGYRILTRTVTYLKYRPNNTVPVYGPDAEEFFRFLRNVFEHGGDLDSNGRQLVLDMEDLDYVAAEVYSDKITQLVWHLVMDVDMTGW